MLSTAIVSWQLRSSKEDEEEEEEGKTAVRKSQNPRLAGEEICADIIQNLVDVWDPYINVQGKELRTLQLRNTSVQFLPAGEELQRVKDHWTGGRLPIFPKLKELDLTHCTLAENVM